MMLIFVIGVQLIMLFLMMRLIVYYIRSHEMAMATSAALINQQHRELCEATEVIDSLTVALNEMDDDEDWMSS